jgi:membrane protease YdiL (CAAX protease family)
MYLLSAAPALILAAIPVIIIAASGGAPVGEGGAIDPAVELPTLVIAILAQFPAWAALVIAWVVSFERRSLATAGFRGPGALGKYGLGLAVGLGIALALAIASPFVDPSAAMDTTDFDVSHLARPEWLVMLGGVVLMFLMQGACEEIAFRGWMMSSVAARWGLVGGVAMNIGTFGLFHIHVFASGLVAGGAAILALTVVGLFLSLWAIQERSIAGVCGVHGAFNAAIVVLGMVGTAGADPEASPGDVLLQTIREATALSGDGSAAGAMLQLLVFAALSGLVWLRIRRTR